MYRRILFASCKLLLSIVSSFLSIVKQWKGVDGKKASHSKIENFRIFVCTKLWMCAIKWWSVARKTHRILHLLWIHEFRQDSWFQMVVFTFYQPKNQASGKIWDFSTLYLLSMAQWHIRCEIIFNVKFLSYSRWCNSNMEKNRHSSSVAYCIV